MIIVIIDYIKWVATPIIVLLFKKNQDMFCCFSKVDDMAKITRFQTLNKSSNDSILDFEGDMSDAEMEKANKQSKLVVEK